MTAQDYWYGDSWLAKGYRKAYELKRVQRNQEMWLEGVYFMHAIEATVGNMLAGKKHTKIKYPDEPLPITQMEAEEREERKAREKMERMKARMFERAMAINKSQKPSEVREGG